MKFRSIIQLLGRLNSDANSQYCDDHIFVLLSIAPRLQLRDESPRVIGVDHPAVHARAAPRNLLPRFEAVMPRHLVPAPGSSRKLGRTGSRPARPSTNSACGSYIQPILFEDISAYRSAARLRSYAPFFLVGHHAGRDRAVREEMAFINSMFRKSHWRAAFLFASI